MARGVKHTGPTKPCAACGAVLPNDAEHFYERKKGTGYLDSRCKPCKRAETLARSAARAQETDRNTCLDCGTGITRIAAETSGRCVSCRWERTRAVREAEARRRRQRARKFGDRQSQIDTRAAEDAIRAATNEVRPCGLG